MLGNELMNDILALLFANLKVTTELKVESLDVYSNSQLEVNQVQGNYLDKDLQSMAYMDEVKTMSMKIKNFKLQ